MLQSFKIPNSDTAREEKGERVVHHTYYFLALILSQLSAIQLYPKPQRKEEPQVSCVNFMLFSERLPLRSAGSGDMDVRRLSASCHFRHTKNGTKRNSSKRPRCCSNENNHMINIKMMINLVLLYVSLSEVSVMAYSSGGPSSFPPRTKPPPLNNKLEPLKQATSLNIVPLQSSSTRYFTSVGVLPPLPRVEDQKSNTNRRIRSKKKNSKDTIATSPQGQGDVSVTYTNNPKVVTDWLDQNLPKNEGCVIGFDVEVSQIYSYLRTLCSQLESPSYLTCLLPSNLLVLTFSLPLIRAGFQPLFS